jgi:prolyl oligopeptidase
MDRITQLREEMRAGLERVAAATMPSPLGPLWMLHRTDPFDGSSVIVVGPQPDRLDRTLLGTRDLPGPKPVIEWAVPSPTGALVAVGLSVDGSEDATVRVIDVATGTLLPDALPHSMMSPVSWLPDGSGFYARHADAAMIDGGTLRTVLHRLGGPTVHERSLDGGAVMVIVEPSGDALAMQGTGTSMTPVHIRRAGSAHWQPVLEPGAGNFIGSLRGDAFVGVTHAGADRGRVVSIPLATAADGGTWTELVPQGDGALRGLAVLAQHLVAFEILDGAHRIRVFRADGTPDHAVELPEPSGLDPLFGFGQGNGSPRVMAAGPTTIAFHLGGFDRPPCPMHYDVVTRVLTPQQPVLRDERIVATRHHALSADGQTVGYWQVRLRGTPGPAPALVYGYGGFNVASHTPCHPTPLMPWLERGGCLLLPQLRGGGEQGESHWRAAMALGKQRTFDDLYAVAGHAVAQGLAAPGRMGFVGASNGGLAAGAAITQRPELFRAVVCAVPVVDLVDMSDQPFACMVARDMGEYGSADVPEHVAAWHRISPLQQLRDGVRYPAVLVDAGEVDVRCTPRQARSFAARLREIAGPTGRRVVLNERRHGGHAAPEGELWPVWLDFMIAELMDSRD